MSAGALLVSHFNAPIASKRLRRLRATSHSWSISLSPLQEQGRYGTGHCPLSSINESQAAALPTHNATNNPLPLLLYPLLTTLFRLLVNMVLAQQPPLRERCITPPRLAIDTKHLPSSLAGSQIHEIPRSPPCDPLAARELIPYLHLAPYALKSDATLPPCPEKHNRWTHMVRLLPATKSAPAGSAELHPPKRQGQPHLLEVRVPAEAFNAAFERGQRTALQDYLPAQSVLIVRDFLALALPYYAAAHPLPTPTESGVGAGWPSSASAVPSLSHSDSDSDSSDSDTSSPLSFQAPSTPRPVSPSADPVNVLLLGPTQLTLSLSLVYISYASGTLVRDVMRGILESSAREAAWAARIIAQGADRMGMSEEELEFLEDGAMNDF
ncbi:hypothetical protein HMN09_01406300 [Mycena chlorophos]|uniref:Uncharacterized protein n=1 Tax=Mycena chlorophos TaxID=658473 RepID=A0A8H6VSE6_MYCCL|nr:hypothetical protein HMN09_01406300 [Mycena chlorophos]